MIKILIKINKYTVVTNIVLLSENKLKIYKRINLFEFTNLLNTFEKFFQFLIMIIMTLY